MTQAWSQIMAGPAVLVSLVEEGRKEGSFNYDG